MSSGHPLSFFSTKKGSMDQLQNRRGITFNDFDYEIFTGLLYYRLNKWVLENKVLTEFQAGFRKNYSTVDNLFVLKSCVNVLWARGYKVIFLFFYRFKQGNSNIFSSSLCSR